MYNSCIYSLKAKYTLFTQHKLFHAKFKIGIFPTPPHKQDVTQSKRSLTGFFLSPRLIAIPKLKRSSLPHDLPIAGGRIVGCISFPRVLVLCEMQIAKSKIRNSVAMSIPYIVHQNLKYLYLFSLTYLFLLYLTIL